MNEGYYTIKEFVTMMSDVEKVESKRHFASEARSYFDSISYSDDVVDIYIEASEKCFAAEKLFKTVLKKFVDKYSSDSRLNHEVLFFNETRLERKYEMIRNSMLNQSRYIIF